MGSRCDHRPDLLTSRSSWSMIRRCEPRQGAKRRGETQQGFLEQEGLGRKRASPRRHGRESAFQQWMALFSHRASSRSRCDLVPFPPNRWRQAGRGRMLHIYMLYIYMCVNYRNMTFSNIINKMSSSYFPLSVGPSVLSGLLSRWAPKGGAATMQILSRPDRIGIVLIRQLLSL